MVEFEKAKLADGKDSFKTGRDKKVKAQFKDKASENDKIKLERLGRKSPDDYKQVMSIKDKSEKLIKKINNGKFTQKFEERERKNFRPKDLNQYNHTPKGVRNTQKQQDQKKVIEGKVDSKKLSYQEKVFKARDNMIDNVIEKHGIQLDHGKTKERIR